MRKKENIPTNAEIKKHVKEIKTTEINGFYQAKKAMMEAEEELLQTLSPKQIELFCNYQKATKEFCQVSMENLYILHAKL